MKGILFKPDMIKAIADERKTVTRRLMNPQPNIKRGILRWQPRKGIDINMNDHADLALPFARFHAGETVYVKEAYSTYGYPEVPFYKDEPNIDIQAIAWHSPMFMPERFARYFLKILAVRPERLYEITEEDCFLEGIKRAETYSKPSSIPEYGALWDLINPLHPWSSNPWVWRIEFTEVKAKLAEYQKEKLAEYQKEK